MGNLPQVYIHHLPISIDLLFLLYSVVMVFGSVVKVKLEDWNYVVNFVNNFDQKWREHIEDSTTSESKIREVVNGEISKIPKVEIPKLPEIDTSQFAMKDHEHEQPEIEIPQIDTSDLVKHDELDQRLDKIEIQITQFINNFHNFIYDLKEKLIKSRLSQQEIEDLKTKLSSTKGQEWKESFKRYNEIKDQTIGEYRPLVNSPSVD